MRSPDDVLNDLRQSANLPAGQCAFIDELIKARICEYMEANSRTLAGEGVVHDEWPNRHIEIDAAKYAAKPGETR